MKVTCAPRLEANERMANLRAQEKAEHAQTDPMKKFDTPVYPQPKPPAAPLAWPAWLVRVDGAKLPIENLPGQLKSTFTSAPSRDAIQAFYAGLLSELSFQVKQGLAAAPEKFGCWVQGRAGPMVIWVKIRPVGQNFAVELTLQ